MTEKELREKLEALYDDALRVYRENGNQNYDAGVLEGVKRVMQELGYAR